MAWYLVCSKVETLVDRPPPPLEGSWVGFLGPSVGCHGSLDLSWLVPGELGAWPGPDWGLHSGILSPGLSWLSTDIHMADHLSQPQCHRVVLWEIISLTPPAPDPPFWWLLSPTSPVSPSALSRFRIMVFLCLLDSFLSHPLGYKLCEKRGLFHLTHVSQLVPGGQRSAWSTSWARWSTRDRGFDCLNLRGPSLHKARP